MNSDLTRFVRQAHKAGERGDFDGLMGVFAPDAVLVMGGVVGASEGRAAIRGLLEDWIGAYEDYEMLLEQSSDLGNSVTFGVFRARGRPLGSSGFVELRHAQVVTWAEGLVQRITIYTDIDKARAAAERLAEERG
jgi:ketosteroid isomerase-like protein